MEARDPASDIGTPLDFAVLACGACVLATATVYAGTGMLDGFASGGVEIVGRKLIKLSLWLLPAAAVAGTLLHWFYTAVLRPGPMVTKAASLLLVAIPRAFFHFPLFGMLALLGVMAAFAWMGLLWCRRRLFGAPPEPADARASLAERMIGIPIWFVMLPLIAVDAPMEGDMTLPKTVAQRALLRWLPFILVGIAFWTGAVSEDSGERVDPYWLTAGATLWLADFLIVAVRVVPVLRARRGLPT